MYKIVQWIALAHSEWYLKYSTVPMPGAQNAVLNAVLLSNSIPIYARHIQN